MYNVVEVFILIQPQFEHKIDGIPLRGGLGLDYTTSGDVARAARFGSGREIGTFYSRRQGLLTTSVPLAY